MDNSSRSNLIKAAVIALLVALLVLFTVILPAEYGLDPLGTGAALGLTQLSEASESGAAIAPVVAGVNTSLPKTYKVDLEQITLFPGMGLEIKYQMEKGAAMVYSWKATGPVMFEFHGEPDQKPNPEYYDSYELDDKIGKKESHGFFIAPSTGIHGWFWENKGDKEVDVTLHTAGFFSVAKYFGASGVEDIPVLDVGEAQ
jgi:hypothetical protein